MRRKAVLGLQRFGVADELIRRAHFARASLFIRQPEKQVAREFDSIANAAAEQFRNGYAKTLAHDVKASKLNRRVKLRTVVVEARRRVADREAQGFELEDIVAF